MAGRRAIVVNNFPQKNCVFFVWEHVSDPLLPFPAPAKENA